MAPGSMVVFEPGEDTTIEATARATLDGTGRRARGRALHRVELRVFVEGSHRTGEVRLEGDTASNYRTSTTRNSSRSHEATDAERTRLSRPRRLRGEAHGDQQPLRGAPGALHAGQRLSRDTLRQAHRWARRRAVERCARGDPRRPGEEREGPCQPWRRSRATRAGDEPVRLHLSARPHRHAHASHGPARRHGRPARVLLAARIRDAAAGARERRGHSAGRLHQRAQCRHLRAGRRLRRCATSSTTAAPPDRASRPAAPTSRFRTAAATCSCRTSRSPRTTRAFTPASRAAPNNSANARRNSSTAAPTCSRSSRRARCSPSAACRARPR